MSDRAFLDDVKLRKLEADPTLGEEMEKMSREAVNQPKEIVERMKKLLGG
jgi:hypothetical protein